MLVRTGKEAAAVRDALRVRGVASVYLSDRDSVFASDEAQDLCLWLRGVAEPQDMRRVRAALGTRTVGLSLAELYELGHGKMSCWTSAPSRCVTCACGLARPGRAGHAAPVAACVGSWPGAGVASPMASAA